MTISEKTQIKQALVETIHDALTQNYGYSVSMQDVVGVLNHPDYQSSVADIERTYSVQRNFFGLSHVQATWAAIWTHQWRIVGVPQSTKGLKRKYGLKGDKYIPFHLSILKLRKGEEKIR